MGAAGAAQSAVGVAGTEATPADVAVDVHVVASGAVTSGSGSGASGLLRDANATPSLLPSSPRAAGSLQSTLEAVLNERRAARAAPMTVPGAVVHLRLRRALRKAGCCRRRVEQWEVRRELPDAGPQARHAALGEIIIGADMLIDHLPHMIWRRLHGAI